MHSIQDISMSVGALIGSVGVVLTAAWGIRSKAITLLRADLETYKDHVKLLESENKRQAERIHVLEQEVQQLRATTNLAPLVVQIERLATAISGLEACMQLHDAQAKAIAVDVQALHGKLEDK
jgi:chromosome segregation ATPase